MKREAANHPKMHDLAARLGIENEHALGLVQRLIWFTADHAIAGDVGKWPDGAIARGCGWQGEPTAFVDALTSAGWLDAHDAHRLILHDWPDHAENWVKAKMKKAKTAFLPDYFATPVRTSEATSVRTSEATGMPTNEPPDYSLEATDTASPNQTKPNQTKPKGRQPPPLPPKLAASDDFRFAWDDWLAYRRESKLTCNRKTLQAQLADLAQHQPGHAAATVRKSIRNGWKGLFPESRSAPNDQAAGKVYDPTRDAEMERAKIVRQLRAEGVPLDDAEVERRLAQSD